MRFAKTSVIALAAWAATCAQATTIEVGGYDPFAGMQVGVKVNGQELTEWAGPFLITINGTQIAQAFCIDFFTSIDYGQTYQVSAQQAGPGNFENAGRLYSTFVNDLRTAGAASAPLYGAALQLALWEVVIDGYNPATASTALSSGSFQESMTNPWTNANPQLETVVKSYLASALGPVTPCTITIKGVDREIQTLITTNVPEPSTWMLMGTALIALGWRRRR